MVILYETVISSKKWQQPVLKECFAFITTGMCFFLQGFTFTYNAFMNIGEGGVTAQQASISGSINFLLMFVGAAIVARIMNKYGRKKAIQYIYFMYIIAGGIILFHNENRPYLFYMSRVVSGLGNSSISLVLLYLSEVCHKSRRGIFAGSVSVIMTSGFLVSYALQYNYHLNVLGFFSGTIACVFLVMSCIIPETKYWYMIKNRQKDAERSSLWFDSSQSQKEMNAELESIVHETSNGGNIFSYLLKWPHFKRFMLTQLLLISRSLCGRAPSAIFPDYYFTSFHLKFDARKLSVGAVICEFVCSILASCLIGKLNRRTTLFFGILTTTSILSLIIMFNIFNDLMNEYCPWLEVICLYLYSSMVMTFVAPLLNLVVVETVSSSNEMRASILAFSLSFTSLYLSINAFVFPFFVENYGIAFPLSYFMFGNFALLMTVLFYLPETHNKALYECGADKKAASHLSNSFHMRY